jgi:hypothetical protein
VYIVLERAKQRRIGGCSVASHGELHNEVTEVIILVKPRIEQLEPVWEISGAAAGRARARARAWHSGRRARASEGTTLVAGRCHCAVEQ